MQIDYASMESHWYALTHHDKHEAGTKHYLFFSESKNIGSLCTLGEEIKTTQAEL